MPTLIRKATLDDLQVVLDFRIKLFDVWNEGTPEMRAANEQYLKRALDDGTFHAWIAERDGRPVGTGAAYFYECAPTPHNLSGREAYILNMYVEPEARRGGTATQLMETMLDYVRAQGITRVWLRASEYGRPVYERLGFEDPGDYLQLDL